MVRALQTLNCSLGAPGARMSLDTKGEFNLNTLIMCVQGNFLIWKENVADSKISRCVDGASIFPLEILCIYHELSNSFYSTMNVENIIKN